MQGRNKLPDSFIVVMKDLSKYDDTVAQIKKIDGVDSISNHRELAKKLTDISNLVNMICIAVVCALTIIQSSSLPTQFVQRCIHEDLKSAL